MLLSYFTQLFFGFLGHNQLISTIYTTGQRNEKLCFFIVAMENVLKL